MKKIILWLVVAVCSYHASGQGTVKVTPGAKIISKNGAYIVMNDMNLANDGNIHQFTGDGTYKFTGSSDVTLGGSGTVIDNLVMFKNGASKVSLTSNIEIKSQINFQGGLLILNNYKVDLSSTGQLVNESESSRAFTTGTGYLEAKGNLTGNSSVNLGSLGVFIKVDKTISNVTIRRGHKLQTGISNQVKRYFDVISEKTKITNALIRFYYFDNELSGQNENLLKLWKSSNNTSWEFAGVDARSTSANYVEKRNMDKFVRLTLSDVVQATAVNAELTSANPLKEIQEAGLLMAKAFPDPFNDYFSLQVSSISNAPISVRVIDATGRLIEERMNIPAEGSLRMGGTKYIPGIYFAEVMQGKDRLVLKIIKQ